MIGDSKFPPIRMLQKFEYHKIYAVKSLSDWLLESDFRKKGPVHSLGLFSTRRSPCLALPRSRSRHWCSGSRYRTTFASRWSLPAFSNPFRRRADPFVGNTSPQLPSFEAGWCPPAPVHPFQRKRDHPPASIDDITRLTTSFIIF